MAGGTGDRSERHGGTTFLFRAMERRLGTVQEAHLDPSFVVHVQSSASRVLGAERAYVLIRTHYRKHLTRC